MTRFTYLDAERAFHDWGCNCGPAALAAICELTLDEVRPHVPGFAERRYTNAPMMMFALRSLGRRFAKARAQWPRFGLVRVQWEGPWTQPGVPIAARYRYTHWIGTKLGHESRGVFDVNCMANETGWVDYEAWCAEVAPLLAAGYPRASGAWHVTHGLEVATS